MNAMRKRQVEEGFDCRAWPQRKAGKQTRGTKKVPAECERDQRQTHKLNSVRIERIDANCQKICKNPKEFRERLRRRRSAHEEHWADARLCGFFFWGGQGTGGP